MTMTVAPSGALDLGLEHEYSVWSDGGWVDARQLFPGAPPGSRRLHPTEEQCFLLSAGLQVHADGYVAEIATPPVPVERGAARALAAWAAAGATELRRLVPADLRLKGESTHLSVSTDSAIVDRVALLYAQTFAPGLMLLMDLPASPGLLIRPRPGRLELCGEFVEGRALEAAALFALGSSLACASAVTTGALRDLAPPLECALEPARMRYGWYVDRVAFGPDLYTERRQARLRLLDGDTMTAGDHLRLAWHAARPHVESVASAEELRVVDDIVDGRLPIPTEGALPGEQRLAAPRSPYRGLVQPRARGCVLVEPVVGTWDFVAFRVQRSHEAVVLSVPRSRLDPFLAALDAGAMDGELARVLDASATAPVLTTWAQTRTTSFFRAVDVGSALLPVDYMGVGDGPVEPVSTDGRVLAMTTGATATRDGAATAGKAPPPVMAVVPDRASTPWWAWVLVLLVPLLAFGATTVVLDDEPVVEVAGPEPSTTTSSTTAPTTTTTTTAAAPETTLPPAVVVTPELVGACIGVDHSPPYADPATGEPVDGASIITWAASYGGVPPGSSVSVPFTGPNGPFVLDGSVGDDGRVGGAEGIFQYGPYEPTGPATVQPAGGGDAVLVDSPVGAIQVGPSEVPCALSSVAAAPPPTTTTPTTAPTTTTSASSTTTAVAVAPPVDDTVFVGPPLTQNDGGAPWWPLIPVGLVVAAGGLLLASRDRRPETPTIAIAIGTPAVEKGNRELEPTRSVTHVLLR